MIFFFPELIEQIEKRLVGRLKLAETHFPALRHIGEHFDGTPEIGVRVPCRSQAPKIGLEERMFRY